MKIDYKAYDVASAIVHPAEGFIVRLAGTFRGTTSTATWIQIHDAKAVPANGAVPKRSWGVSDESPFQQTWTDTELSFLIGCVVVLSTTEGTLTIASEKMDLFVEGESTYDNTGCTVTGDLTTGDDTLQAWADAAGPKTLKRIEFTSLVAASQTVYALLFASDSPQDGDVSPFPPIELPNNTSIDARFDEVNLFSQGSGVVSGSIRANDGVIADGLTVCISEIPTSLLSPASDSLYAIRVTYK